MSRHCQLGLLQEKQDTGVNNITVEFSIPDDVVGVLMSKVKEDNSVMNYLREICSPAVIWIPFRDGQRFVRKLIITGQFAEEVDDARFILYNFIRSEIGFDLAYLHPIYEAQVTMARSRSSHSKSELRERSSSFMSRSSQKRCICRLSPKRSKKTPSKRS